MEFDSVSQYRYNSLKVPLNIVFKATDGLAILRSPVTALVIVPYYI